MLQPLFNDAHREKLNSVQEFVKIKSWLLLILSACLHNQLKFNCKVLHMFKQDHSSRRQKMCGCFFQQILREDLRWFLS